MMGSEKSSGTTITNQTTTPTPTAEETALNKLQLEQAQQAQPGVLQANQSSLNLINQLLTGQALPGYLNTLPGGISPDVTQGIVNQSLRDVGSNMNFQGILDSGTAASIGARTAGDIRLSAEEFNLQNLMQLMNLASGQAAQNQQIQGGTVNALGQRLAGLRPINQMGSVSNTQTSMNPFLKSFQQGMGAVPGNILSRFGQGSGMYGGGTL